MPSSSSYFVSGAIGRYSARLMVCVVLSHILNGLLATTQRNNQVISPVVAAVLFTTAAAIQPWLNEFGALQR